MDPIAQELEDSNLGIQIYGEHFIISIWVDDILIIANTKQQLNKSLKIIKQITDKLKLTIDPTKSTAIGWKMWGKRTVCDNKDIHIGDQRHQTRLLKEPTSLLRTRTHPHPFCTNTTKESKQLIQISKRRIMQTRTSIGKLSIAISALMISGPRYNATSHLITKKALTKLEATIS